MNPKNNTDVRNEWKIKFMGCAFSRFDDNRPNCRALIEPVCLRCGKCSFWKDKETYVPYDPEKKKRVREDES